LLELDELNGLYPIRQGSIRRVSPFVFDSVTDALPATPN
jgi:hypothetical protein